MKRTDWIKRASGLFVPPMLRWSPGYPCCCCGGVPPSSECVNCSGTGVNAPYGFLVELDGFADNSSCGCTVFNGDFIATEDGLWGGGGSCGWSYDFDGCEYPCTNMTYESCGITVSVKPPFSSGCPGQYAIEVATYYLLNSGRLFVGARFRLCTDDKINCLRLNGTNVPLNEVRQCAGTPTCAITSVKE
jgi:hypothetical protein